MRSVDVCLFHTTKRGASKQAVYDRQIAAITGLCTILNDQAPDEVSSTASSPGPPPTGIATRNSLLRLSLRRSPRAPSSLAHVQGAGNLRVAAWLALIGFLLGATKSDKSVTALEKLSRPSQRRSRRSGLHGLHGIAGVRTQKPFVLTVLRIFFPDGFFVAISLNVLRI